MSDPSATAHPDELLAGFVDGTLPAEDRATVERHVAGCARCTEELALAGEARSVLRALPQLDAPGITLQDLRVVTPITKARRWNRIAWGAGIAAAAALVVVFALVSLHPSRTTPAAAGGDKAAGASNGVLPGIVSSGMDYDASSLSSLASRLIAGSGRMAVEVPGTNPGGAFLPTGASMVSCLRQGAGLEATAMPTYLEVASYQGTPVYVGAFVTQPPTGSSSSHLLLVVVTRDGCLPVTVVRQPL